MAHLRDSDCIASTHRGHGHCIAKGVDVYGMMAEIYGKKTGVCGGKGGSMHIADLEKGMLGANGIVGAGAPLVAGAALAAKLKGRDDVSVASSATAPPTRAVFEAMNLASVWNLPCIFVAENNGYAEATASNWSVACDHIADRAAGFGMPGVTVDGFDFFAVHEAAGAPSSAPAPARAVADRGQAQPLLRPLRGRRADLPRPDEVKNLRESRDCLMQFRNKTTRAGLLRPSNWTPSTPRRGPDRRRRARAKSDPKPQPADLLTDVYVAYP
jgi:pyruvate dehydrogenase E1 component alpha subunit